MALPTQYVVATVRYGVPERPLQLNVCWFSVTGSSTAADDQVLANQIAQELAADYSSSLADITTTETDLIGIEASWHAAGNVFVGTAPFADLAGTITGDTLPEYCAAVAQKRTSVAGKSGRGRWYFGCVPESFADNSKITFTGVTNYNVHLANLQAPVTISGITMTPALHSAKLATLQTIAAYKLDDQLGTQRRRRVRPLL